MSLSGRGTSSAPKFPYQRLRSQDDDFGHPADVVKPRSWLKLRLKRVPLIRVRRRLRLKIPSLRRFLRLRRKLKSISCVRGAVAKVVNRLKQGQSHLGDLFAGNYLLVQINPCSIKTVGKAYGCALPPHHLTTFPPTAA